MFFQT